MDFFQWEQNPWGQETLVRISWDLLWAAFFAGLAFIILHQVMRRAWFPKRGGTAEREEIEPTEEVGVPKKVLRHPLASRLFHWTMAAAMLVLLVTAFFPVLGIQFPWVTIHWSAGLVLIGAIVFHIIHATFWMDLRAVWIDSTDLKGAWRRVMGNLGRGAKTPKRHGKYPLENKLYHHIIVVVSTAVMVTGVLMMFRVETPFLERNPYMYAESTWGWIYVAHGLAAVGLVTLIMAHIYFAVLPEKWWLTLAMIFGRVDRENYLRHHDPDRWKVAAEPPDAT